MYTVGPGVWLEKCKMWKMCQTHCRTWNMARKMKNVENETKTLFHLECGKKTEKRGR